MAYSFVTYTSTGAQNYNVPFPYLDVDHVKVLINGSVTVAFSWTDGATIHLTGAPAVGATILVKRETPRDAMGYSFAAQPRLKGEDLDNALLQAYYIGLEALDNASHDVLQAYVDGAQTAQAAAELAETNAETADGNAGLAQAAAEQAVLDAAAAGAVQTGLAEDARDAAVVAQGLAEDAADLAASYAGAAGAGNYQEVPSAPSTLANEVKMYAKDVTGVTELFIRKEGDGAEIQVTSGSILNGTPPDASEGTKGIAELATQAEVDAGADDARIVTPLKLYATPGIYRKNVLINGAFRINQRAYTSTAALATGAYGHDRWKAGAGGGDYSFTQTAGKTTITIAAGKTLIQVVEDKNVVGGSYTLSWTGTAQARYAVDSATPAGAYAASPILITGQTAGTTLSVEFNEGTLGAVQLEIGSAATPFEFLPYSTELALCQRYLPSFAGTGAAFGNWIGQAYSTANAQVDVPFPVEARIAPTGIVTSAASNFRIYSKSGGGLTATGITFASASKNGGSLDVSTGNTDLVQGGATHLYASGETYLYFTGCEL